MKLRTSLLASTLIGSAIALLVGCSSFTQGRPPTAVESKFFDVQTNYTPEIHFLTNMVPVTVFQTNTVTVTNIQGVTEFKTNVVPVTVNQPQVSAETNLVPSYNWNANQTAKDTQSTIGAIGNLFGVGGLASTAFAALIAGWKWFSSSKNAATAGNLAQGLEAARVLLQNVPGGPAYDAEFVKWLQQHQAEAGVLNQVMTILDKQVDNRDAQAAFQQIKSALADLGFTVPTVPPASPKV